MNFFIDEQKKEVLIAADQHFNVVDFLCERSLLPWLAYNTDQHLNLPFSIFIDELASILCLFLLFIRLVQIKKKRNKLLTSASKSCILATTAIELT